MASEFRCVYIFRGLPGSGKSHRASLLAVEAQKKGQSVRYCSEEFFFVGPDGKFRFNESRVDEARLFCMESLRQALADDVQLICVDNISATQASYAHLLQLAALFKYETQVVEMPCPDLAGLQHFFARSRKTTPSEGYSYDYVVSLWSLWEPHTEHAYPPTVNNFHGHSMSFDEGLSIPSRNNPLPTHLTQPGAQLSQYYPEHAAQSFSQPSQSFLESHSSTKPSFSTSQLTHRPHAKKEELLQQLHHLKQQEVVLQQQLKQQKLCDQLSSRPRRFPHRRETTTVILAPYTPPQVNTSRSKYDKPSSFSFPLLEKY